MPEGWWEKRVDSEIEQLRSEIRGVQNLMLRGAIAFCIVVQVIGMVVLAISDKS
ncbi:MAG TPA: hypothetical protein VFP17_03710 [Solirubrobacterales bacterium]|nr:hypothetical protein [Solirubrobacterales bacterium]